MNPPRFLHPPATPFCPSVRHRRGAFALVVTLLILSLLVIVAVSYLAGMSSERQTADAYDAKAVAEQAAQTGVDSASAMLAECFRDFPDSATVWDTRQSLSKIDSSLPPLNQAIVDTSANIPPNCNQGTSLYLRAVPTGSLPVVANPLPDGRPAPGATPIPANSATGNNPNNPKCQTFVLPLISGVPGGQARLVTEKTSIFPAAMILNEPDPAKQNWTDLNVRRMSGDKQGVIGSSPDWSNVGPEPARAYWVNLRGNDGLLKGRYAFWIDDESFRVNVNKAGNPPGRADNGSAGGKYPADQITGQPYVLKPSDTSLAGVLTTAFAGTSPYAQNILDTRALYPGSFLPDPLAFVHTAGSSDGTAALPTSILDALRYLTTTQSGALNLTRHGTQRLNLNTTVTTVGLADANYAGTVQKQVNQLVQAIQFHLPNFGQRFYRTDTGTTYSTLNATQVPTSITNVGNPRLIYLYKVAANVRDYLDSDSQPTMIQPDATKTTGAVYTGLPSPIQPFGDDNQPNPMWAIGKEASPFLQETAVRFRPVAPQDSNKGTYRLQVDYYLEFWNMTDHDVYASPQSDPTLAHLNNAQVRISNQQSWLSYPSGSPLTSDDPAKPAPQNKVSDFTIDLTGGGNSGGVVSLNGVAQDGTNGKPLGVVFRAGTATVITTDPDYQTYNLLGSTHTQSGAPVVNPYKSVTGFPNLATTFYCPIVPNGARSFSGPLANKGAVKPDYGLYPDFRDGTGSGSNSEDYQTEVTFFNSYGYLDSVLFGVSEGGGAISTYTDKGNEDGGYCNYSYGGSLVGNTGTYSIPSQVGDPRTNNEQMFFHRYSGPVNKGDLSRYFNGNHTLGYPDANYDQPASGTANNSWPDYYTWPAAVGGTIYPDPDATTAPAVIADKPLFSIGQLGDVYDPARIASALNDAAFARGGGRTFKIGQHDDRLTYDATGSPGTNPNSPLNNVPASLGWAAWRLTDIFSAGPVDSSKPYGTMQEPVELPGRININGVWRDNGAALRTLLTNFVFEPRTSSEPLFHTPPALDGVALLTQPPPAGNTAPYYGVAKLVDQMKTRLQTQPAAANVPWGPFFERGELGELQVGNTAIFGQNAANAFQTSIDLTKTVDLNHTFDHGREELFRRISELICTRGDTFTVYAVGQALTQTSTAATPKITGTQRIRVTFRLVPKQIINGIVYNFNPACNLSPADGTVASGFDFNPGTPPAVPSDVTKRFAKPDRYDIQILEVNSF